MEVLEINVKLERKIEELKQEVQIKRNKFKQEERKVRVLNHEDSK